MKPPLSTTAIPLKKLYFNQRPKHLASKYLVKRCFRCLAKDHKAAACRDPVRCLCCLGFGHRAQQCKVRSAPSEIGNNMNRLLHRQDREPVAKVFVPYTDEYLRRREIRRDLGYIDDFAVSRYRERDFAIFLPEWVPAEDLTRREVLTLSDFWIRCYPWGQYRYARPHRSRVRAWIRLINLPFEIWTVPRVAAMVSGFGRFVKADSVTKAMTDLRAFRCQVVLDSVRDVPQNLSIVLDEEQHPVMVHIESWERIEEGGRGDPPVPPRNGPEEGGMDEDGDDNSQRTGGMKVNRRLRTR
uniref:CCHC-type domain-containing protein n=1 Tax=Ananas comosus var. bracteatus TaxID=296719 RepID=A0A6V7QYG8_ANACO